MKNYAVIQNNIVTNIIIWDGMATWSPPQGSSLVDLTDTATPDIGSSYDGTTFTPPVRPEINPKPNKIK